MSNPVRSRGALLGAAFLMATSAIGPGFLTQTTVFTVQLGASLGFVILLSVLIDLGAQINIWRVVVASGQRGPQLASQVVPGLGHVLTVLVVLGGLAFNIGNIAGTGLGMEAAFGVPAKWGATAIAVVAIGLFLNKDAGRAVDMFSRVLGLGMILLTGWVVLSAHPPLGVVAYRTFWPEKIDTSAILTLVGGTVGGYISFAGAHRLLDAGYGGPAQIHLVTRSALQGIGVATFMRVLLFLAAWGVVATGASIDPANPPASVFQIAAGVWGYRFFGLVIWAAAITSVVGATFTSLSFLTSSFPKATAYYNVMLVVFVLFSLLVFVGIGKPVTLLVWAGKANGYILPLALAAILLAARRPELTQGYRLPLVWQIIGWVVVAVMGGMAVG